MKRHSWSWVRRGVVLLVLAGLACTAPEAQPDDARESTAPSDQAPAPDVVEQVDATLYYASADGAWLVPTRQEVPLASDTLAQGRQLLEAQLGDAPDGLISVFPAGTRLRGFYVTDRDEAFVDLSSEIAAAHPGGALREQLTVYAVVNAVTSNLPTIQRVQILIGGREVDTLAGHIDLRWPLEADPFLVRDARPD